MSIVSFAFGACVGALGTIVFFGVYALRLEKAKKPEKPKQSTQPTSKQITYKYYGS